MADRKANAHLRFALALAGVLVVPEIQAEDGQKKPEISHPFRIEIVDDETGRGVPLVELRTVNQIRYVTDSNGIAAFDEPGLLGRKVFFHIKSHGYEFPRDGFGNRGLALETSPRGSARIKIKRLNIARRLYRVIPVPIYAVQENVSSVWLVAGSSLAEDARSREIAFFAPDRPGLAAVPIVEHRDENSGEWLLTSKSTGSGAGSTVENGQSPLLYVIPADAGKPPAGTVPLLAFRQQAGPGVYYSPIADPKTGFQRSDRPVGLVWSNPSRLRIW